MHVSVCCADFSFFFFTLFTDFLLCSVQVGSDVSSTPLVVSPFLTDEMSWTCASSLVPPLSPDSEMGGAPATDSHGLRLV